MIFVPFRVKVYYIWAQRSWCWSHRVSVPYKRKIINHSYSRYMMSIELTVDAFNKNIRSEDYKESETSYSLSALNSMLVWDWYTYITVKTDLWWPIPGGCIYIQGRFIARCTQALPVSFFISHLIESLTCLTFSFSSTSSLGCIVF